MSDKRLRDYVRHGSELDIQTALRTLSQSMSALQNWLQTSQPRTPMTLILNNILNCARDYVRIAEPMSGNPIQVIALATRSVYELNIRLRTILTTKDDYLVWQAEAGTDRIQVYEALLELATPDTTEAAKVLKDEIQRTKDLIVKHRLRENVKPISSTQLANKLGLAGEHRALYKLFSKLVHPTSWLVNDYTATRSPETRNILLIHLQLYGWDTVQRIKDQFAVANDEVAT